MSSPSNTFECRWHASGQLLAVYLFAQAFALGALLSLDLSYSSLGVLVCLAHAVWVLPRHVLLTHRSSVRGLRRDDSGWQLWSAALGWHGVQLRPDSLALPLIVVLTLCRKLRPAKGVQPQRAIIGWLLTGLPWGSGLVPGG